MNLFAGLFLLVKHLNVPLVLNLLGGLSVRNTARSPGCVALAKLQFIYIYIFIFSPQCLIVLLILQFYLA